MRRKSNFLFILSTFALMAQICTLCQTKLTAQTTLVNSDRDSYSILYVPEKRNIGPMLQPGLNREFVNRFDWNNLPSKTVSPTNYDLNQLAAQLTTEGIGRQIMAFWWRRSPDGNFHLDTIARRGQFNAGTHQRTVDSLGPRGDAAVDESGLRLIPRSYVVVMRPVNVLSMQEVYDQQEREARANGNNEKIERSMRGYQGGMEAYVFQFQYDEATKNAFYEMWPYETDDAATRKKKAEAFDRYPFRLAGGIKYTLSNISYTVLASSLTDTKNTPKLDVTDLIKNGLPKSTNSALTDDQLLREWAEKAVNKVYDKILGKGSYSNLVNGVRPVKSEIGTKEGLYPEKRFAIYEVVETSNGQTKLVRKALVRATNHIVDNTSRNNGPDIYSRFYRVGGLGRIHKGMIIKERREAGIGIHGLAAVGDFNEFSDYGGGAEINLSLYLAKAGLRKVPLGMKLGVNYTLSKDTIRALGSTPLAADASRLSVYLRKDIHFLSILRLGLWAGYGRETMTEDTKEETKKSLRSDYIPAGAELGLTIFRGLNAFAQGEYMIPIGSVYEGDTERTDLDWKNLYSKRVGFVTRFGLRYTF